METVWRGLDRAGLDRAYNARASVADYEAEVARFVALSAAARERLRPLADVVYDPGTGLGLDWFAGAPGGAVVLWIHGGYWRALSKAEQSLVAPGLVAAGSHVAVMDYALAPAASLDTIVHQVRSAAAFVVRVAEAMGADPGRVFVAGHSAGGQLVGMLLAAGWHGDYGLAADAVRGGISLSGLFDLEPIRLSYINEWLGLDAAAAERLSPMRHVPAAGRAPRLLVSYGGLESDEFRRQSEAYAAAWCAAGHEARVAAQAGRQHFDLVVGFGDAGDPLCRAACAFIEGV